MIGRRNKSGSAKRIWRLSRVALLVLIAWQLLAWIAAKALIVNAELPHADAIAVLAGSSTYLERTHRAAQLFHEGRGAKIALTNDNLHSGWSGEGSSHRQGKRSIACSRWPTSGGRKRRMC